LDNEEEENNDNKNESMKNREDALTKMVQEQNEKTQDFLEKNRQKRRNKKDLPVVSDDKDGDEDGMFGKDAVKNLLKQSGKLAAKGTSKVARTSHQEVIKPIIDLTIASELPQLFPMLRTAQDLLSKNLFKTAGNIIEMGLLSQLPALAPVLDKSKRLLKFFGGGLGKIFKFITGKKNKPENKKSMPDSNSPFTDDSGDKPLPESMSESLDILSDIADGIEWQNDFIQGVFEGIQEGMLDKQRDTEDMIEMVVGFGQGLMDGIQEHADMFGDKISNFVSTIEKIEKNTRPKRVRKTNKNFINKEKSREGTVKQRSLNLLKGKSKNKKVKGPKIGLLARLLPLALLGKVGLAFILKWTGIAFALKFLKKLGTGKKFAKLTALFKKFGKFFGVILKPLRFLAGPLMTALRVGVMAIAAGFTALSLPVVLIAAAIAGIVLGAVLLAKKLGGGNIKEGFVIMWQKISGFFGGLKDMIKQKIEDGKQVIYDKISTFLSGMETFGEFIKSIPIRLKEMAYNVLSKIPVIGKKFKTEALEVDANSEVNTTNADKKKKVGLFKQASTNLVKLAPPTLIFSSAQNIVEKAKENIKARKRVDRIESKTAMKKQENLEMSRKYIQKVKSEEKKSMDKEKESLTINSNTQNVTNVNETNVIRPRRYATPNRDVIFGY